MRYRKSSSEGEFTFLVELRYIKGMVIRLDPVKELIDKGWNTVNIKTISGRKEETIRENVILNEESGQFDFSDMAIQTSSLEKVSEDENTVVLESDFFILTDFVSRYGKIPSITREDSFVEVTITRIN